MVDARHPRSVIELVVFRSERLETKPIALERHWDGELGRNERLGHTNNLRAPMPSAIQQPIGATHIYRCHRTAHRAQ